MRLIILMKFGPQSMPDHPNREWHAAKRDMIADLASSPQIGGELHDLFWTLGPFDLVIHAEVRDQIAAHAFSLTLSRKLKAEHIGMSALSDADVDPVFDVLYVRNGP